MSVELCPGVRMPSIGFGVYQVPALTATEVVRSALEVGYRHIDTAQVHDKATFKHIMSNYLSALGTNTP